MLGKRPVMGLGVGVEEFLQKLSRVADGGQEQDSGDDAQKGRSRGFAMKVFLIAVGGGRDSVAEHGILQRKLPGHGFENVKADGGGKGESEQNRPGIEREAKAVGFVLLDLSKGIEIPFLMVSPGKVDERLAPPARKRRVPKPGRRRF